MFKDSNDFSVLGSNPVTSACAEFIIERISPFESVINFINLPGLIFAFSFSKIMLRYNFRNRGERGLSCKVLTTFLIFFILSVES